MSFDLRVSSGDLALSPDGDLERLVDTKKLIQDIVKILTTQLGANPFFPWYGSPITRSLTGRVLEERFVSSVATQQLRAALERLQTLQRGQLSENQVVTPLETLAAIQSVIVEQNPIDARFYRIFLVVLSRALQPVPISMDFEVL